MQNSAEIVLSPPVVPRGELWHHNNLLWQGFATVGAPEEAFSPLDGLSTQTAHVLAPPDLRACFGVAAPPATWTESDTFAFAARLRAQLEALAVPLRESVQIETAFSDVDCDEIMEGTLFYLEGFRAYYAAVNVADSPVTSYDVGSTRRRIVVKRCPWGTVAAMLPQNALLFVGVVCILSALITGNRVILRAPLPGARTAALLARAVWQAAPPQGSVSIVAAKGREFLEAAYASPHPTLIHYLGASQFGGDILKDAFDGAQPALIDGTGNTWVWASERQDPVQIARLLTEGATRYNGQTCTSINGAVIHPAIFDEVCQHLRTIWGQLRAGNPLQGAAIGGLFDAKQAEFCRGRAANCGGQILCGGGAHGNVLEPTLIQSPSLESDLVREGVFGPVLWLRAGNREDFVAQWPLNRYPLCAGVLDADFDADWWLGRLPNLARLVVNGDPSIEHPYEPWGGYPASGANPVSYWHQKYQRRLAFDAPEPRV